MANNLFGWDLTYQSVKDVITKKEDVLVALIHWKLIKHGFLCLGIGDEKTVSKDDSTTEVLPADWNKGEQCKLRYKYVDEVYILHTLITDGNAIINLLRTSNLQVSNVAVNVDQTVHRLSGSLETMVPDYRNLIYNLDKNLIDVVTDKLRSASSTQTDAPNSSSRERDQPDLLVDNRARIGMLGRVGPDDVFSVGRSDLDPLGGGGGGMLFNPFGSSTRPRADPGFGITGGLGRGAVPPGARFDPFSPLPQGGQPRRPRGPPDSDHFAPPGYDDMFM